MNNAAQRIRALGAQLAAPTDPQLIQQADLLRAEITAACKRFEQASRGDDKDYLRALHVYAKRQAQGFDPASMLRLFRKHQKYFRAGSQITPEKIKPTLRLVVGHRSLEGELFRLVRAMWSMPNNKGYGRRLRFIVFDEYHEAVIGIIGLQSPPADLGSRDQLFAYPEGQKLDLVNSTLDAYTVGAVPPYTYLLGGKLCAGLISSDFIRQAYWRQYAGERTVMDNRAIRQHLVAVTTTGAFGRSSMYNRLKFHDRLLAEPIGYTLGFGTLHLEHLYEEITRHLRQIGLFKEGGFGAGPKIRWQNIVNALGVLKLPGTLLNHGVKREVFLFRFMSDLEGGMSGGSYGEPISLATNEFGEYWKQRWAIPRSNRYPDWNQGDVHAMLRNALQ